MNSYLALIRMNFRLSMRDRSLIFFNYLFPLIFLFVFAQMMRADQSSVIVQVVNMVLTIAVLGSGLWGQGMRSVVEREANILRRFKVAPITPTPILISSLTVGLLHFVPIFILILGIAHYGYGMPIPRRLPSLIAFVAIGLLAFRGIGLIIASVVNSAQESQILIQILYMPMLFLSGATIPIAIMPNWVQIVAQFLPATHLFAGMQAILLGNETLAQNVTAVVALLVTAAVGTFIAVKLFRWEKEEKLQPAAKLWVLAILAPFVALGVHQAYSKDSIAKMKTLDRTLERSGSILLKNARVFVGDGSVIENGSVLVRNGTIAEVYEGAAPDAKSLKASEIEAAGKTLMPGLIDVHVHLAAPGGVYEKPSDYDPKKNIQHALAAYLFSGITAVRSVGDPLDMLAAERARIDSGERLGAEVFATGPLFTAEGGHGTEMLKYIPEQYRANFLQQFVRLPNTPAEARSMVDALKAKGVDGIKAVLDAGAPGMLFNRMDLSILGAIAAESHAQKLPLAVHTGNSHDVADAIAVDPASLEHGSARDPIADELFARMKARNIDYDPTLSVVEGVLASEAGDPAPLNRSLVQQVGPASLLKTTRAQLKAHAGWAKTLGIDMATAKRNLNRAFTDGVTLVTGSDAGNPLTFHGPTVHREMQLWVQAGVPARVALQAATYNAAKLLGASGRLGLIRKGHEATLLLVDGNPLEDISATERISLVLFKGERIRRQDLFDQK
jgi:imidazolonepropionase-like amidohydrolase/ABC-type multidrug transport system permease subunit